MTDQRTAMAREAHWEEFYLGGTLIGDPTDFARFVADRFRNRGCIIDCACGEGRDTAWFAQNGRVAVGIDKSQAAIQAAIIRPVKSAQRPEFIRMNVTSDEFGKFLQRKIVDPRDTIIYSRFFHHAITGVEEFEFIKKIEKYVKLGAVYCMEARSIEDKNEFKTYEGHYRRFIALDALVEQFSSRGIGLQYKNVKRGLARFKSEDPIVVRAFFGEKHA